MVDAIVDKTGMKGTGTWTVRDAALQGVPIPTIAAALTARQLSGILDERKDASKVLCPAALCQRASERAVPRCFMCCELHACCCDLVLCVFL